MIFLSKATGLFCLFFLLREPPAMMDLLVLQERGLVYILTKFTIFEFHLSYFS